MNKFTIVSNKKNNKKYQWINWQNILEWCKIFLVSFCFVYLINTFIIINANVPTSSMVTTINPNEKIIASRLSYIKSSPQRQDIVVFKYPDDKSILYVKRIIGLPNDEVEIKNGHLYVNNNLIEEKYVTVQDGNSYGPYKVPKNSYFMLGDNRPFSNDARFWKNKYVKENDILGKVFIKYNIFPLRLKQIK